MWRPRETIEVLACGSFLSIVWLSCMLLEQPCKSPCRLVCRGLGAKEGPFSSGGRYRLEYFSHAPEWLYVKDLRTRAHWTFFPEHAHTQPTLACTPEVDRRWIPSRRAPQTASVAWASSGREEKKRRWGRVRPRRASVTRVTHRQHHWHHVR